jgi:hypothetical protein
MNGRAFGQEVEQRIERGADGQWRAVGPRGGWISRADERGASLA